MSHRSEEIKRRIAELNSLTGNTTTMIATEERCMPVVPMIAVAVPIVLYITLYVLAPKIGCFLAADSTPQHPVRNKKRIGLTTLIVTALVWGGLLWYYKFRGSRDVCVV